MAILALRVRFYLLATQLQPFLALTGTVARVVFKFNYNSRSKINDSGDCQKLLSFMSTHTVLRIGISRYLGESFYRRGNWHSRQKKRGAKQSRVSRNRCDLLDQEKQQRDLQI